MSIKSIVEFEYFTPNTVEEAVALADRAIVMQPKPGRLFDEVPLVLARPRDKASAAMESASRRGLASLTRSLREPDGPARERDAAAAALWW